MASMFNIWMLFLLYSSCVILYISSGYESDLVSQLLRPSLIHFVQYEVLHPCVG